MDRLSFLPDEIICHILSFLLRTKSSVQTSVLSKIWRFLWTRVPFLAFDSDDTRRPDIITNILLQQHKHDIDRFRISIGNHIDEIEEEFQSWIVNLTTRNSRNLVIAVQSFGIGFKLPQCLFTCKTLVHLSLYRCGVIPMSGIYFPALKKLQLHYVGFESLAYLISGCPVLEEFSIQGIMLGHFCVSSPTLTRLLLRLDNNDSSFGVYLDTPALRYLRLFSVMPDELSAVALDSLIEADITLFEHQHNFIYPRKVLPFVGKLYNVKLLTLTIHGMPVVYDSVFSASAIKFHNLTKLELRAANLGFITFFLENANNLQVLEFTILPGKGDNENEYGWVEPKQVPECLISHLQTVDLCWIGSFESAFEVLRYILVNGKILKKIKVPTPRPHKLDREKKLKTLKKVALIEIGSQVCEHVFYQNSLDWPSLYARMAWLIFNNHA